MSDPTAPPSPMPGLTGLAEMLKLLAALNRAMKSLAPMLRTATPYVLALLKCVQLACQSLEETLNSLAASTLAAAE